MREFVFNDGGSNKFWRIDLRGASFEVTFGRAGTKGQTQKKSFGSAADAKNAHDALISEKRNKGYTESTATGASDASASEEAVASAVRGPQKDAAVAPPSDGPSRSASSPPTLSTDTRRIDLDPLDWRWATWRNLPPPAPPAPRPFDLDDGVARLAKLKQPGKYEQRLDFPRAGIRPHMQPEEARFWWAAMTAFDPKRTVASFAEGMRKKKLATPGIGAAAKVLSARTTYQGPELGYVLSGLYEPMEVMRKLVLPMVLPNSLGHRGPGDVFYAIREDAFMRLTDADRSALREAIRGELEPGNFPSDFYEMPSGAFLLAPLLGGLGDELGAVVRSWKNDRFGKHSWDDSYQVPQHIVFGLGTAAVVEAEMRRLNLKLRQPEYVRAWLAHTEFGALDYFAATIVAQTNKADAAALAKLAHLVHAREMVGPMQTVMKKSKAPQVALAWFEAHPGLGPGGTGTTATAATATPPATHSSATAPATVPTTATLTPTPVSPPSAEVLALRDALAKSTLDEPDPRVVEARQSGDAAELDAFAWDLFLGWLREGAPPKQKWRMMAVGLLGGDASALKLAPLVRSWPGESQHARAALGLECLRAIGTDVALMQLSGIALNVKFPALRRRAEACMEEIAAARGMSRDDLEDRIVPDGGFDAEGKREFDFGARRFIATLGPSGAPLLRDAAGETRDDLPKPNAKDDAARAKAAVEAWKIFKKTVKDTVKIQAERLERAMVTGRSWSAPDFDALLVHHPLMGHLARLVLWGAFDGAAQITPFRVAEDRSLADVNDDVFALPAASTVRVVHPQALPADVRARFAEIFADYAIVAPFEQLGRATFVATALEAKSDDVAARFADHTYDVRAFSSRLKKAGWRHAMPEDAGFVGAHGKSFTAAGVAAVVEHTGYPIGAPEYADPQRILHVRFVRSEETGYRKKCLRIGEVDPIVFSEVILDLTRLSS